MTDHPMQLSHEEFADWLAEAVRQHPYTHPSDTAGHVAQLAYAIARRAYSAGADAELEECCQWLQDAGYVSTHIPMRAARRPRPPKLKERALMAFRSCVTGLAFDYLPEEREIIRLAIEALPDDPA